MPLLDAITAALAPRPEPARCDPETHCIGCDGRGFVRWFVAGRDPRPGHWMTQVCLMCCGEATAGAYVIQCHADRWRYEMKFVTRTVGAALTHAARAARRLARSSLGIRRVQVTFVPETPTGCGSPAVVYSIAVAPRKE